ncbi:MAG: hypothetical protein KatS3mg125_1309 [Lysobacterales bacterium]|jgi:iron-sulfur cluster assembly protein|nr:MAG: hypothetical protein KatS3mg125_1309 [Xanthomonadales bacterium]
MNEIVRLTPAALARVQKLLSGKAQTAALRFGVRKAGCSGHAYRMELCEGPSPGDVLVEQEGVRILIDAESLPMVRGTEIDFERQNFGERFVFRNPNVTAECGCGESFTTRPEFAR